jgi:cell division protein FtsL
MDYLGDREIHKLDDIVEAVGSKKENVKKELTELKKAKKVINPAHGKWEAI